MRCVTDLACAAPLALLLALAGCVGSAPELPPPSPAFVLPRAGASGAETTAATVLPGIAIAPERVPADSASTPAVSARGPARPDPTPAAGPSPPAPPVAAPTSVERYWGWSLLAEAVGLTLYLGGVFNRDMAPWLSAGASLPAGIVHLIFQRPEAALLATTLRAGVYLGAWALQDAALRTAMSGSLSGYFSSMLNAGLLLTAGVTICSVIDVLVLSRREVPTPGWQQLRVLPTVSLEPGRVLVGLGAAF